MATMGSPVRGIAGRDDREPVAKQKAAELLRAEADGSLLGYPATTEGDQGGLAWQGM